MAISNPQHKKHNKSRNKSFLYQLEASFIIKRNNILNSLSGKYQFFMLKWSLDFSKNLLRRMNMIKMLPKTTCVEIFNNKYVNIVSNRMRVGRKSDPSLLILYAVQDVGLDYNDKVFIKLIVTYNKTNCLSLPYHCATTVDYKLTSSTGNTLKASMYDHYINQQLTSMLLKS